MKVNQNFREISAFYVGVSYFVHKSAHENLPNSTYTIMDKL